jgi:glycosyltransferase involved in cell wall biosynthesis
MSSAIAASERAPSVHAEWLVLERAARADRPSDDPIRVLFLIRSLDVGGAERQLLELVRRMSPARVESTVAVMYSGGALLGELERCDGVGCVSLGKRSRWDLARVASRLRTVAREVRPHVVHGYLDAGNLMGLLVGRTLRVPVVFGVRASLTVASEYDAFTSFAAAAARRSGRLADLVISNSEAARRTHLAAGVPDARIAVVPNGIDAERFRPDRGARAAARIRWCVPQDALVVGNVARFDPIKDHATFVRAAARVAERVPPARFVCAGGGEDSARDRVRGLAAELGVADRFIWQPEGPSDASLYAGFDVHVSSSSSEGFSNAVAEAMSCAVPCVATDVGDSAAIIGETGLVVPPGDPEAMGDAIAALVTSPALAALRPAARARIQARYDPQKLVEDTTTRLEGVARGARRCT